MSFLDFPLIENPRKGEELKSSFLITKPFFMELQSYILGEQTVNKGLEEMVIVDGKDERFSVDTLKG